MIETVQGNEPASSTLCKSCGLCCTGHLFIHAYMDPAEVETARDLGLSVLQADPDIPVISLPCPPSVLAHLFPLLSLPCPLWRGICTVYTHPHKPSICGEFKCKLLDELEQEATSLRQALAFVRGAKELIRELEVLLPAGGVVNFRERLFEHVQQLEGDMPPTEAGNAFRQKAGALLAVFSLRFGVTGLFKGPGQGPSDP